MKFPWKWSTLLQLWSLTSLVSATGTGGEKGESGARASLIFGLRLSSAVASPAESLSQPLLSLEPDLFVQFGSHELSLPIMPLHLLGKKSWNVYNRDNIEKVKRDEAAAKAKEEAEEQRMQEIDAERRIRILRGEVLTPLPEVNDDTDGNLRETRSHKPGKDRKRRKYAGENDTDFEMRLANERSQLSNADKQIVLRNPTDAPLVDHSGHINLFPQERSRRGVEKNAEAEKESEKKKTEYEDQYTMRFSNAAGFKQRLESPWYSKAASRIEAVEDVPGKDVWGNEDPRRKEREVARTVSNDPLVAMRHGAAKVRQVERERKRWREEKEREMQELIEAEEERKGRKRRYQDEDEDDLEGFTLHKSEPVSSQRWGDDHGRERKTHRESGRKSRKDDGEKHKHRHRHRHRD